MSHFVIDASAWKLRLRPQRAYMSRKFSFLFGRTTRGSLNPQHRL